MLRVEVDRETVTYDGIVEDDGNGHRLACHVIGPFGESQRLVNMEIKISDKKHLKRLRAYTPGDEIEITTETDWTAPSIPTVLKNVRKLRRAFRRTRDKELKV